jgi:hypothetical protein
MSTEQVVSSTRPKRPRSVWVLAVANGLLAVFMIASSLMAEDRGFTSSQAAFNGIVGLAISISAHATWFGYRYGRNLLLALITVYLGLLCIQSVQTVAWAIDMGYGGSLLSWAVARTLLSILWLAVNYWFLLGKQARAFYA